MSLQEGLPRHPFLPEKGGVDAVFQEDSFDRVAANLVTQIVECSSSSSMVPASKVEYLIVSGVNHVKHYDEPTDMKSSLMLAGVPGENIYCDYAGFRTLDSVVRAREILGQTRVKAVLDAWVLRTGPKFLGPAVVPGIPQAAPPHLDDKAESR
jgi:vancomycin permeability regulator SanA